MRDHRRCRISLEVLEDRLMLSTVQWINSSGGDWDTPSNWSTGALPGPGDDVVIDVTRITVTHSSSASDSIHSLDSQATLSLSNGTLSIAASSTLSDLNVSDGTLTGAGDLTVTGTMNWSGGTMSGTGTTTLAQGGALDLSYILSLDGRTLVNAGTATWTSDGQYDRTSMAAGATIDNQAGATFTITGVPSISGSQTPTSTFNNAGTLIRSGASGAAVFSSVAFNNSGSVQVQAGDLDLPGGDSTGSFQVSSGATLGFGAGGSRGTQTLESTSRIDGAGTVFFDGGTVNLMGTYDLGAAGKTYLQFGSANFTSPVASLGKSLVMDGGIADFSSGTPDTVPVLDLSGATLTESGDLTVTDTLNWTGGTMSGSGTITAAAGATFNLNGILSLDRCTLVNAGSATCSGDYQYDAFYASDGATIDNQVGATFRVTNDAVLVYSTPTGGGELTFNNSGLFVKTEETGQALFQGVELNNTGTVRLDSGTLELFGDLIVNGDGVLTGEPGATLLLADNSTLQGQTRNAEYFGPEPTVLFLNKTDGTAPVQVLEAMSEDLGNTSAGFFQNFAYDTLEVGISPYDSHLQLEDAAHNTSSTSPEAVYVNTLIVPQDSILDLNGLHMYARSAQISGTVLGGSVSIVPPGGSIPLNASAPGDLAAASQIDDWSFYGRADQSVAVTVHTGAGGTPAPPAPALNWAEVTLLDANGNVLATAVNSQSGSDATLAPLTLPADGIYHIHVQAPSDQPGSTGNYVLDTYGSPVHDYPLTLNQQANSQLDSPVSVDRWEFSAVADVQVQLHVVAAANPGIQFDLTGPGGFTGFTGLTADSPSVTLPTSGTYTLTVRAGGGQPGAYAFELQSSPIDLALGTAFQEPLAGSGQSQLFRVQMADASPLLIDLQDGDTGDENEVYAKFGAPPTRADYDCRFSAPASANQLLTVPMAPAGTWYILVYNPLVAQAGNYTLTATASTILVTGNSPPRLSTIHDDVLTLIGAGFDPTTTIALVVADGTVLPADAVALISATQMTATFSAGTVAPGVYTVRATHADGSSSQVAGALTIVPNGQGVLTTNLVVPNRLIPHGLPAEIDIEYSNTGDDALPAPLLILTATQDGNQDAFLTLDPTLIQSGTWNAAVPDGYTNSIQFLASGATPGLLQPGESIRVPVYWGGWLESKWDNNSPVIFQLDVAQPDDQTPGAQAALQSQSSSGSSSGGSSSGDNIPWDQLEDQLRPAAIPPDAWAPIFANLIARLGSTWSDYLSRLAADAEYLGTLPPEPSASMNSGPVGVSFESSTGQGSSSSSGSAVTAGSSFQISDPSLLLGFEVELVNGLSPVTTLSSSVDGAVAAPGPSLDVSRVFSNSIASRYQLGPFGLGWWWSDGWQRTLSVQSDGTVVIADGNGTQRIFQPDMRGGYFDQPGDHATLTNLGSGVYTLTEIDGTVTAFRADGKVDYVQDTNGNRITAGYTNGLLTSLTDSSGQSLQIAYNSAGRIISIIDPASGRTATYTYDPSDEYLLSAKGFDGLTTTYAYETGSNPATRNALLLVTNPDGTHEFFAYDPEGRLTDQHLDDGADDVTYSYGPAGAVTATDASGGTTTYFFDAAGLVAKVADPLGRDTLYTYDSDFNLAQMTDSAGQYYTYTYDSNGNLTQETDPLGQTTSFGYAGPFSRLTSATDQDGNTTLYGYDSNGNETSTTYADGSVEQYAYDAVGDPKTLTNRRGDPITYQYDGSGRLTSETFADGTEMTYSYDAQGNLISTTDPTGTTTLAYDSHDDLLQITYPDGTFLQYSYDAIGELTHAVFASTNPSVVPNEDLQYLYDAAGNRTQTIINGVTTDYVTNNLNQYTSIGNETLTYDPDGNLISTTEGSQTSTYTFNDLNQRRLQHTRRGLHGPVRRPGVPGGDRHQRPDHVVRGRSIGAPECGRRIRRGRRAHRAL